MKNHPKRMVYWGCNGFDGQGHLHTHLLVKVPLETEIERFQGVCRESWTKVVGKNGEVFFSTNDTGVFGPKDRESIVSYTTLPRHSGFDDEGLDTTSVVVSHNYYEMTTK